MVCKRVKIAGVLLAGVLAACTVARAAMAGETVKPRESEPADPTAPKLADYQDLFERDIFSRIPRKTQKQKDDDLKAYQEKRDQPRTPYVPPVRIEPNYDNDIVLYGLVDKSELQQAFIDDRHAKKLTSVKTGDKVGSGKVGAISLAGMEFVGASGKPVLVSIGRNLQGGVSTADATEPPQLRPGDQPGDEGLSPEERMKRRRMRENGIAVPATPPDAKVGDVKAGDVKPGEVKTADVKPGDVKPFEVRADNKAPDDSNLSFEEKMRRRRQMEQNGLLPPGPPRSDVPPNQNNATQPGVKPGEAAVLKPGDTTAKPPDSNRLDDPDLSQEDRIKILEELLRQNLENNDKQVER